ncbi:hypothetical protein BKA70DRAFT_1119876 [Coprinopsis sp. MPI-PUGE-AT-0042]|nr:hypothetical protein BKA70DRAFT_1119876 [Coprinopsis sp. MPI-PUGE-AT-0042]
METLRALVCCCGSRKGARDSPEPQIYIDSEEHVIPTEESPLIPSDLDNPSYTDEPYLNTKLRERLSTVVRSKEGKMVNLGSTVPFNLHNRTLLSDRTVSRSASGSLDVSHRGHFSSEQYLDDTGGGRRYGQATAMYSPRYMESRSPSPSHDEESSRSSRFEPVAEQPKPTAPLGVKLVNYTGPTTSRGRARERPGHVTQGSKSPPSRQMSGETNEAGLGWEAGVSGKPITAKKPLVELDDASSIVMSWGD